MVCYFLKNNTVLNNWHWYFCCSCGGSQWAVLWWTSGESRLLQLGEAEQLGITGLIALQAELVYLLKRTSECVHPYSYAPVLLLYQW